MVFEGEIVAVEEELSGEGDESAGAEYAGAGPAAVEVSPLDFELAVAHGAEE